MWRRSNSRFTAGSSFRRATGAARSGYQVAFVAFQDGKPSADPVPFLTGLVPDPSGSDVYGRPVGVAVAPDGALLVLLLLRPIFRKTGSLRREARAGYGSFLS